MLVALANSWKARRNLHWRNKDCDRAVLGLEIGEKPSGMSVGKVWHSRGRWGRQPARKGTLAVDSTERGTGPDLPLSLLRSMLVIPNPSPELRFPICKLFWGAWECG